MLRQVGGLTVVVVVATVVAGGLLGQPAGLAFVETDSMAPTLSPGDGFVAVPAALTDDPERGDVVVYRAEQLHGGGLVTHRVVAVRGDTYVTKGDANPFTDQDNVEPPVRDGQIVAEALQIGDTVIALPDFGTAATAVREAVDRARDHFVAATGLYVVGDGQTVLRGFAVAALVAYLLSEGDRYGSRRDRSTDRVGGVDPRVVALAVAVLVVLAPTVSALAATDSQEFGLTAAPDDPQAVAPGGEKTGEFTLANGGVVPMVVRVEAPPAVEPSVTVTRLDGGERLDATATLAAPSTPGRYRWETTYRWYPALLPQSVTGPLYRHHPWLPLVVTDLVLGGAAYLVSRRLLGSSRVHLYGNRGVLGRRRSRR